MTHQSSTSYVPGEAASGRQVARLRHVLALVEEIAGQPSSFSGHALDEDAMISSAYEDAPPIVQRRFDALAAEIAAWAATGVKLLLRDTANPPRAAARRLAEDLSRALRKLGRTVAS